MQSVKFILNKDFMFSWVKEKLVGAFAPKYVGALVRSLLQAAAGALALANLAPEVISKFTIAAEPVLTGLILYLISLAWSFAEKAKK